MKCFLFLLNVVHLLDLRQDTSYVMKIAWDTSVQGPEYPRDFGSTHADSCSETKDFEGIKRESRVNETVCLVLSGHRVVMPKGPAQPYTHCPASAPMAAARSLQYESGHTPRSSLQVTLSGLGPSGFEESRTVSVSPSYSQYNGDVITVPANKRRSEPIQRQPGNAAFNMPGSVGRAPANVPAWSGSRAAGVDVQHDFSASGGADLTDQRSRGGSGQQKYEVHIIVLTLIIILILRTMFVTVARSCCQS